MMRPSTTVQPILVAACGNLRAGDDAFGPIVAQRLRTRNIPGVDVVDLGMKPAGLLDQQLLDRAALIIVDAAEESSDVRADELIDVDFMSPRRPALRHDIALSSHGLSIAHELALAQKLGWLPPRVHLIAAVAHATTMGDEPSPQIVRIIPVAVRSILTLARQWHEENATALGPP